MTKNIERQCDLEYNEFLKNCSAVVYTFGLHQEDPESYSWLEWFARVLERRVWLMVEPRFQKDRCDFSSWLWNSGPALLSLQAALCCLGLCPTGYMCFVDLDHWDHVPHGTLWSSSFVCIALIKSDLFPGHVGTPTGLPSITGKVHHLFFSPYVFMNIVCHAYLSKKLLLSDYPTSKACLAECISNGWLFLLEGREALIY